MLFVAFYDRTARPRQQAAGGNAGHQEEIRENVIGLGDSYPCSFRICLCLNCFFKLQFAIDAPSCYRFIYICKQPRGNISTRLLHQRFLSSYLYFIFRHNLSCYFYLTVIYLNYQLSLIYICLECYLMSVAAGLFCRKMDGRFCRKKPDTDVRRAGRIDVAGVFCRTREGRGQSRSLH